MFSLGSMISPKAGLNIVKNTLAKTINQDVKKFDIIYDATRNVIDFRLYDYTDDNGKFHDRLRVKYADGAKLCGIIAGMLKDKLSPGEKIDIALISYELLTVDLYISKDGNKIQKSIKL